MDIIIKIPSELARNMFDNPENYNFVINNKEITLLENDKPIGLHWGFTPDNMETGIRYAKSFKIEGETVFIKSVKL